MQLKLNWLHENTTSALAGVELLRLRRGARKMGPKSESGRGSAFVGTGSNHYQSGVHPLGNVVKPGSTSVPELKVGFNPHSGRYRSGPGSKPDLGLIPVPSQFEYMTAPSGQPGISQSATSI